MMNFFNVAKYRTERLQPVWQMASLCKDRQRADRVVRDQLQDYVRCCDLKFKPFVSTLLQRDHLFIQRCAYLAEELLIDSATTVGCRQNNICIKERT